MSETESRTLVLQYVKSQVNEVTAWRVPCSGNPSIHDIRVFDWTTHTLRARGITWRVVAQNLGLAS